MSLSLTLDEVKASLRIDHDDDDAQLLTLISASVRQIDVFLKVKNEADYTDYETDDIRTAAIMLVGALYRTPDAGNGAEWIDGLPHPIYRMLYPYRTPTVA